MTTTAGQVAVKLNLDKKQFETGMKEAKRSVDLLGSAFSSIAALGIGATLLNIGKNALKASSDFEQAQVSFGVMLGSAEKATKLVDKLQNMANVTPFETQDLLDASKTLLNFNVALEDVVPDLQMLGDISGGNSEKMRSLTLAFAQMSSAGRLMGQDLLQMINAGFNPLQEISLKTGKSMATLKDEMSEGKITVEMVTEAFRQATSEGGRFYGMMDKQSQTLEGVMSTMSDAYTLMTRSISDMALPAIKEQVIEVTKAIEKTTEHINSLKEWASVNQSTVYGIKNAVIALAALAAGIPLTTKVVVGLITAYRNLGVVTATTTAYQLAFANLLKGNATLALIQYRAAITATIVQIKALTVAMLSNPLTWVTVVLGAGAAAWWKYQQSIHETTNAIKEINAVQDQQVDKTTEAIKAIQELQGVKKLDYNQTKRLDEAIEYLTEKYPNYIGKLREELKLKGEISQATAEQIANELTLAKVKELSERKEKIDKKVERAVKGYKQNQLIMAARYGTPIETGDTGRKGASKSLQRDQDAVNKELEKVKKEREAIIVELTALNNKASEVSSSKGSSSGSSSAKDEKQKQKEALDLKIAQLEIEKYETQKNADEIYQINLRQAEARIAAAKAGTSEYAQALAAKLQLEREYETKQKALKSQQVVDDLTYQKQEIDNQMAMVQLEYDARKISKTRLIELEIAFINQKKALEEAALKEQLKLVEGNAAEEVKIKRASQKVMEEYNIQANRKALELWNYQKQGFKNMTTDISSGWGSTIKDLVNGEISFTQAIDGLLDTVLNSFGNMCGTMVQNWLADHMTMETVTKLFGITKVATDQTVIASNTALTASQTAVATASAATAATTSASAGVTAGAMTGLGTAVNFVTSPIMKLAGAMGALAVSSGAVAISMPIIAIATATTALSAALAAFSVGLMNTALMMSSPIAMMFAPVSALLAVEMGVVAAAATTAAAAVGKLAVALAASSAAAIPFVGWVLAPAAAVATGAGIAAGQMLAASAVQFREHGGDVKKGQPYIVGEKRPELFVPDRDGRIEPNLNSLNGGNGGMSQTNYQTTVVVQAIDTKDFKQRVGDLTPFIHGNLQKGIKKRQLDNLGGK